MRFMRPLSRVHILFLKKLLEEALVKALSTVTIASGIYFFKNFKCTPLSKQS